MPSSEAWANMRRREFIAGLSGAVAMPLTSRAQQTSLPADLRSAPMDANPFAPWSWPLFTGDQKALPTYCPCCLATRRHGRVKVNADPCRSRISPARVCHPHRRYRERPRRFYVRFRWGKFWTCRPSVLLRAPPLTTQHQAISAATSTGGARLAFIGARPAITAALRPRLLFNHLVGASQEEAARRGQVP